MHVPTYTINNNSDARLLNQGQKKNESKKGRDYMPRAKRVSSIDLSLRVSMQNAKNAFREYDVFESSMP